MLYEKKKKFSTSHSRITGRNDIVNSLYDLRRVINDRDSSRDKSIVDLNYNLILDLNVILLTKYMISFICCDLPFANLSL